MKAHTMRDIIIFIRTMQNISRASQLVADSKPGGNTAMYREGHSHGYLQAAEELRMFFDIQLPKEVLLIPKAKLKDTVNVELVDDLAVDQCDDSIVVEELIMPS